MAAAPPKARAAIPAPMAAMKGVFPTVRMASHPPATIAASAPDREPEAMAVTAKKSEAPEARIPFAMEVGCERRATRPPRSLTSELARPAPRPQPIAITVAK